MKFYKQLKPMNCNIVAIEDVFSYLHQHHTFKEVEKGLPHHTFGNWITEIGIYFEEMGIKTKLISNRENLRTTNNMFLDALKKYKKIGNFKDRKIRKSDIKDKPIIINVDACKIRHELNRHGPHYIVILKEKKGLYMYDGLDFNKKVKVTFDEIYNYSLDINRHLGNGMWLIIE